MLKILLILMFILSTSSLICFASEEDLNLNNTLSSIEEINEQLAQHADSAKDTEQKDLMMSVQHSLLLLKSTVAIYQKYDLEKRIGDAIDAVDNAWKNVNNYVPKLANDKEFLQSLDELERLQIELKYAEKYSHNIKPKLAKFSKLLEKAGKGMSVIDTGESLIKLRSEIMDGNLTLLTCMETGTSTLKTGVEFFGGPGGKALVSAVDAGVDVLAWYTNLVGDSLRKNIESKSSTISKTLGNFNKATKSRILQLQKQGKEINEKLIRSVLVSEAIKARQELQITVGGDPVPDTPDGNNFKEYYNRSINLLDKISEDEEAQKERIKIINNWLLNRENIVKLPVSSGELNKITEEINVAKSRYTDENHETKLNRKPKEITSEKLQAKKTKAKKLWNKNHELALQYEKLIQAGNEDTEEGKSIRTQLNQTGAEYGALRAEIREQEPGYGSYYDTAGTVAKRTKRSQSFNVADASGTERAKKDIDTMPGHAVSRTLNEQIVEADKLYKKTCDLADRYAELVKFGKKNTSEGRKVRNLLNITGKKYSHLRAEIRKQDHDYGLYGYFYGHNYPTSWTVEHWLKGTKQVIKEDSDPNHTTGSIKTDALAIINGRAWNELSKSEKVKLGILGRNYKVARGDSKDIIAWGYNVYQLAMKTPAIPERYDYKSTPLKIYTRQIASTYEHSDLPGMPNNYSLEVKEETTRLYQDAAQAEIIRQAEERRRLEEERRRWEEQRRREEERRRREEREATTHPVEHEPSSPPDPVTPATQSLTGGYAYVQNQYSRSAGDPGSINTDVDDFGTIDGYDHTPNVGEKVQLPITVPNDNRVSMTVTGKYQYMSWGEWSGGVADAPVHLHAVVGPEGNSPESIPSTGSATYHGSVIGDYYDANGPVPTAGPFPQQTKTVEVNAIGGMANITADFAARSVSGELNLTHNGGAFADVFFHNVSMDRWGGYRGGLSSATANGSFEGGFVGPHAEETGGSFHVQRNDGTGAIGIYHARQ